MRVLFLSAFARLPAGIDPGAPAGHSLRKIGNTNCPPAAEPLCRAGRDAFMQMPEPDRRVIAAKADIVAALRAIVPGEGVIGDEEELRAYESDGLTAYRQPPLIVVLPETTAQVRSEERRVGKEGGSTCSSRGV